MLLFWCLIDRFPVRLWHLGAFIEPCTGILSIWAFQHTFVGWYLCFLSPFVCHLFRCCLNHRCLFISRIFLLVFHVYWIIGVCTVVYVRILVFYENRKVAKSLLAGNKPKQHTSFPQTVRNHPDNGQYNSLNFCWTFCGTCGVTEMGTNIVPKDQTNYYYNHYEIKYKKHMTMVMTHSSCMTDTSTSS